MKKRHSRLRRYALPLGVLTLVSATVSEPPALPSTDDETEPHSRDSIPSIDDSSKSEPIDTLRYKNLTINDYERVAAELEIPTAAIRAIVSIEAGPKAKGFNPDSTPIISFDLAMFRQAAKQRGINIDLYKESHPDVFNKLNKKKFGSTQKAQYARLKSAMSIDSIAALEGTFWGMFQIGGFNWKLCGCESVFEFVERTSYSELEQLELFADFMRARRLVKYIKSRDWDAFSLRYNGPGYKKHSYELRLAKAYEEFSK
ncbi:MAG: N-acetylmuramidase family protein [Bacteroidales bacterium]|nr:N-acetylmuramidase family protein [Bacteroidales bacterium]